MAPEICRKQESDRPIKIEFSLVSCVKLTKLVLYAIPTTAAIERIFNIAGFIIRGRRSYMSDSRFEFRLFNNVQCKSHGVYEL